MNAAVADCLVTDYEALVTGLDLPDPDDRHVLAAAIRCGAQVIVTMNLRHFPPESLRRYHIDPQHPDDFVLGLIDLAPGAVASIVMQQAAALKNPPRSPAELLGTLRDQTLVQSVARLRELLGVLGS
jgi:hypothetical protein